MEKCKLEDTVIERAISILRNSFPCTDGLQYPGNGLCIRNKSLLRFNAVFNKSVRTLYQPDHWVCVINMKSDSHTEVWLYDSLHPTSVSKCILVLLTSLLRLIEQPNTITVRINYSIVPDSPVDALYAAFTPLPQQ